MSKLIKKIKKYFNKKGFTLVELLAVIVVLAIIMLLAIPNVLSVLNVSRRKAFVEYVDKVYVSTQKKMMEEEISGVSSLGCKTYYIKKDIGLSNTGDFDGFVLVKNDGTNESTFYITMHDNEFKVTSYKYDGTLDYNNLESFESGDEINERLTCLVAGCSSCSGGEDLTGEQACSSIQTVSDSTPNGFSGSGTSSSPYLIESIEDLVYLSQKTNDSSLGKNKYFKLALDLSFDCDKSYIDPNGTTFGDINGDGTVSGIKTELTTGKGFTPIGIEDHYFDSSFDGNGKIIYGLYINAGGKSNVGFIGYARAEGNPYIVKDLSMIDADVTATGSNIGIIVGEGFFYDGEAKISNLSTSGKLTCGSHCGGVVGYFTANGNNSSVENCVNRATVNASGQYSGGVVGDLFKGTASHLTNHGSITLGNSYSGGVIGRAYESKGTISNLENRGSITCKHSVCAGVIGDAYGNEINSAYNYGNVVSNPYTYSYVGGVIGDLENAENRWTSNIYNYGSVTGTNSYVGGAVGNIYYANLYNAYNYGAVTYTGAGSGYVGGITGHVNGGSVLRNGGNHGVVKSNGYFALGGAVGHGEGIISNIYNYGEVISDESTTMSYASNISIGGIVGYGCAINSYSIANITFNNHAASFDSDYVGLAVGQSYSSRDCYNLFAIGNITNKASFSNYNYYYAGVFGNLSSSNKVYKNYYVKGRITGYPKIGVFAGYNGHNTADNIYVDLYTDASAIKDSRNSDVTGYSSYYANLNNSPHKQSFSLAKEYDFSQVNGMWFRDTLHLGNNWKYQNGYYPLLYKVTPAGDLKSELVEGQSNKSLS